MWQMQHGAYTRACSRLRLEHRQTETPFDVLKSDADRPCCGVAIGVVDEQLRSGPGRQPVAIEEREPAKTLADGLRRVR